MYFFDLGINLFSKSISNKLAIPGGELPKLSGSGRQLNSPNCTFLESWVFDNINLVDALFAKAL